MRGGSSWTVQPMPIVGAALGRTSLAVDFTPPAREAATLKAACAPAGADARRRARSVSAAPAMAAMRAASAASPSQFNRLLPLPDGTGCGVGGASGVDALGVGWLGGQYGLCGEGGGGAEIGAVGTG
jgi:hypothetical protein